VFCPFLWDSRPHPALDGTFAFHDPRDNFRPVLAISEEGSVSMRRWAEREEFAENLRLLYVALTRAKLRCYVAWGAIRDARGSALAWLLHPPRDSTRAEHEPSNGARFEGLDDDALMAELGTIVARSGGTVQLACVSEQGPQGTPLQPATDGGHSLSARVFSGHIKVGPQITSFSALTNHQGKSFSDHHEASVITDTDPLSSDTRDIFSFPRGAQAGDCLHSLFQRLDFTARDPGKHIQQTQQVLTEHGFEEAWTPVIVDTIDKVLATPLDRDKTLRLHDLPWARRLNEVEFCYPLAEYEVSTWYQFLAAYRRAHLPSSQGIHEYRPLASVGGFMKGFIDLVFESRGQFYIVDYKSNWLGPTCEAYAHACLPEVMVRECYDLQYLIYTVALHRYLRHRVPGYHYERHFGGVFYLFLRGMHPALGAAAGVFAARPEREWIEALDASMETGTPATPI
jgi:exodeoxyribonuclease V beta subunit